MSKSFHFSFNRDENLEFGRGKLLKFDKKQAYSARKLSKMNVMSEEFTIFANKVCRMCL